MRLFREIAAELFVMAAIGIVLGVLGPFGTFPMPIVPRLAAWLAFALIGYACFRPVIAAGAVLSERAAVPRLLAQALACGIAALPMTLIVGWALSGMRLARMTADGLADLYPYVLLVGLLATAIQSLLFGRAAPTPPAPPEPAASPARPEMPRSAPAPATSFLDRLPPALGRDLLCLEMEDHYVRAHTALGSTLLLMRMRDATIELDGIEGARVHRSWWVARGAVAGTLRRDRATALRLSNGLEVPVARSELPLLRARGWL